LGVLFVAGEVVVEEAVFAEGSAQEEGDEGGDGEECDCGAECDAAGEEGEEAGGVAGVSDVAVRAGGDGLVVAVVLDSDGG